MKDDARKIRRALRQRGYDDGRAGRPAASLEAEYQVSWRRGQEARRAATGGRPLSP